jgi:valyl-tRNA synthetase
VYVAEAVDMDFLKRKFLREIERDGKFIAGVQAKLSNGQFLKNAPAELVAAEKVKLEGALRRTANLESYIRDMG